jgi:anthranilate synthase component I
MIFPNFEQFTELAQKGNFIPVYREWIADLETPVSAWYKICKDQSYSFLLESVEGGETIGRYSFLGCDPAWILQTNGNMTKQIYRDGTIKDFAGDPLTILNGCIQSIHPVKLPELPAGIGGIFGFWGYELINWIEPTVPIYPHSDDDLPDGLWMQIDSLIIFDQVKRKIWAIAYADLQTNDLETAYEKAGDRIEMLVNKLQLPLTGKDTVLSWKSPNVNQQEENFTYTSNTTKEKFCANVEKAKEYIKAGDIFQVVISQRLTSEYEGDPFALYRSLRLINPSPFMAYFNFNNWQLIGSSPEILVKSERKESGEMMAILRPIAGTRRRGKTVKEDEELATELLKDPKEIAEHIMLVDLGRNDLGRVCDKGEVKVDELMSIERYSHVMHIVSNVIGKIDDQKTAWDLLKACFPAGTVSGAPKIRAMQIIHELEGVKRGAYSGGYGYYDFEGQLNTAITIRTMVVRNQQGKNIVSVQSGAGIVADSVPEKEYEETINKARGLLIAIGCLQ